MHQMIKAKSDKSVNKNQQGSPKKDPRKLSFPDQANYLPLGGCHKLSQGKGNHAKVGHIGNFNFTGQIKKTHHQGHGHNHTRDPQINWYIICPY